MMRWVVSVVLACLTTVSCLEGNAPPAGLAETPMGNGPVVRWDIHERPFPEIPLPNDVATRPDATSPTGRRLNISVTGGETELEREVRRAANELDGFGPYAPITVSFDAPLDLTVFHSRHADHIDENDAVYVINVDRRSPGYGERIKLDLGRGHFPATLLRPDAYFPYDPRDSQSNLLFETVDEDLNGNGRLDRGEDTDFDGVLDRPNTWDRDATNVQTWPVGEDPDRDLVTFFERETNTLIIRPVVPLREATRYAVVLTNDVVGLDGQPVRSPFFFVNHTRQTSDLGPLTELLPRYGRSIDDVAFAWTYTTQSITRELTAIRRGLYGHGPFGWLAEAYPAEIDHLYPAYDEATADRPNVFAVRVSEHPAFWTALAALLSPGSPASNQALVESLDHVEHLVLFSWQTPSFLVDDDGHAVAGSTAWEANEDEHWRIDVDAGTVVHGPDPNIAFCAIPKTVPGEHEPPFDVVLYAHGYGGSKHHALGFIGYFAQRGLAVCGMDAEGHGLPLPPDLRGIAESLLASEGLTGLLEPLEGVRAHDLNNDGVLDPGGDIWNIDAFHSRDTVRQIVVDYMQLIRLIRSFDGKRQWKFDVDGDGENELAGDFDADGAVDFGGEGVTYTATGQSEGGIVSAVLGSAEPAVVAAAPVVGGGGLTDIGVRSTQIGIPEMVVLPLMAPMILAEPEVVDELYTGRYQLAFLLPNFAETTRRVFAYIDEPEPGTSIVLRNTVTGQERWAIFDSASPPTGVRVQVQGDANFASETLAEMKLDPTTFGDDDYEPPIVGDTTALGDRLLVALVLPDGSETIVDTFEVDVDWFGVRYPRGAPLVNLYPGYGLRRQTPELRRFMGLAQHIVAPADPINWVRYYFDEPLDYSDIEPGRSPITNLLITSTPGDNDVPIYTQIALGRASGLLGYDEPDGRYGDRSQAEVLIDNFVVEGNLRLSRFGDVLFDPDNLSMGTDGYSAPRLIPPLRATVETPTGTSAFRMPFPDPTGRHGIYPPDPAAEFDHDGFATFQQILFLESAGTVVSDDPCLESGPCVSAP